MKTETTHVEGCYCVYCVFSPVLGQTRRGKFILKVASVEPVSRCGSMDFSGTQGEAGEGEQVKKAEHGKWEGYYREAAQRDFERRQLIAALKRLKACLFTEQTGEEMQAVEQADAALRAAGEEV